MEHLHFINIAHRNLKPAVIFLDSQFNPYLSEFYNERQINMQEKYKYTLADTSVYRAPEFMEDYNSHQNSFAIDVYAYGVTLFSLLSKRMPFEGCSDADVFTKVTSGERPEFDPSIS